MPFCTRPPMGRIIEIDYLLGQKRCPNAPQLAKQLEVNIRTVYRDIDYMRYRFQAPIEFDRERNGYYYTEEGYVLPIMRLTEGELVAIFLAEKALPYPYLCSPLWKRGVRGDLKYKDTLGNLEKDPWRRIPVSKSP